MKYSVTDILLDFALLIILLATVFLLAGCQLTVNPNGARTYSADPEAFLRAIEIIADK